MEKRLKEGIYDSLKQNLEGSSWVDEKGNKYTLEIEYGKNCLSDEGISFFARYEDQQKVLLNTFHPTIPDKKNLEHLSVKEPYQEISETKPYFSIKDLRDRN